MEEGLELERLHVGGGAGDQQRQGVEDKVQPKGRLWQATFLVNEVASRIQYGQNEMSIQSLNAGFHIL